VEHVIEVRPERCGLCGTLLLGEDTEPERHQVTDFPRIRPVAMLALMTRVHTLLEEGAAGADAKTQGTCRNLLKREAALWTFVWESGVEPTNNSAERP
jgi:hypothetical protein